MRLIAEQILQKNRLSESKDVTIETIKKTQRRKNKQVENRASRNSGKMSSHRNTHVIEVTQGKKGVTEKIFEEIMVRAFPS